MFFFLTQPYSQGLCFPVSQLFHKQKITFTDTSCTYSKILLLVPVLWLSCHFAVSPFDTWAAFLWLHRSRKAGDSSMSTQNVSQHESRGTKMAPAQAQKTNKHRRQGTKPSLIKLICAFMGLYPSKNQICTRFKTQLKLIVCLYTLHIKQDWDTVP